MDAKVMKSKVVPFSLKDAPSLIERVWPAQMISVEAQRERKAVHGQTLTSLGSYWKGRKPLVLVRACILGALLPSTGDDEKDLAIFEKLMGMSDDQVACRFKEKVSVEEVQKFGTVSQQSALIDDDGQGTTLRKLPKAQRESLMGSVIQRMPYDVRAQKLLRPEEVDESVLTGPALDEVNKHLGTDASNLSELLEQLGLMRFGRRPVVVDTFSGSGSIPFEAARLGCDVFASDLNPIACMLTWAALNVVGGSDASRKEIQQEQAALAKAVDEEITRLGIEHDSHGNRAKVFLYCLEARCPQTQWLVPLAPTFVVSEARRVVARLVPNKSKKQFDLEIVSGANAKEMAEAAAGTVRDGKMVYSLDGETYSTPIKTIRGDRREAGGIAANNLRLWEKSDVAPRSGDILSERLYCIQWIEQETVGKSRQVTFFASPTAADLKRELKVKNLVSHKLKEWQEGGFVSDMEIETGKENEGPIRTNGWKFWHQMFMPRAILTAALIAEHGQGRAHAALSLCKYLDNNSKSCRWKVSQSGGDGGAVSTFDSQALKTIFNWAFRALNVAPWQLGEFARSPIRTNATIECVDARNFRHSMDLSITDPPYADAVNYHEITEFFIAWIRKNTPTEFEEWTWDSRRPLAIKGDGEDFRHGMVDAYKAMSEKMAPNGLEIVMFTHQSASVWADMAQIFWGAGLQVMAAWYIATETTSDLKKGGYVQGTVILVARKRREREAGYKDEIVQEVKAEVADQIDTMSGLSQNLKGRGRIENLFEDADLQMAGYAAALRVLTKYERIDGTDMTKEALRPRRAGEKNIVGEIIDFAVQVANEHMVPEHMPPKLWGDLSGAERFYFKMLDIETTSLRKLDNYQNFAKAFRVNDYSALMGSMEPNKARLKSAKEFKKAGFEIPDFGPSSTRSALFAIFELESDVEGDDVLSHLKDLMPNYHNKREDLAAIADYIARKRETVDETESRAARILHGLIRNERLG
ncbi:DNA methylase containing a Zn-ribbon [Rhodopseudomonas palustris BisB5]|uniref:DNA methylase containing a Zn-ribbon n=1 Tax=Rhodopseudomonas palustris (strain BisB5) TaxID=316057 RepID=Q13F86_RHOPS|nr:DNA methylase containing a Zn-ribbon [Rhodopseudomonas palustris BisB5]